MAKSILGLPESAQTTEIKDQISQLVKSVGKNAPPSVNRETVRDFIQNWPESNEFKNLFRGIYEYVKNMNMQPYTMLDIPDTIEGRETRTFLVANQEKINTHSNIFLVSRRQAVVLIIRLWSFQGCIEIAKNFLQLLRIFSFF